VGSHRKTQTGGLQVGDPRVRPSRLSQ